MIIRSCTKKYSNRFGTRSRLASSTCCSLITQILKNSHILWKGYAIPPITSKNIHFGNPAPSLVVFYSLELTNVHRIRLDCGIEKKKQIRGSRCELCLVSLPPQTVNKASLHVLSTVSPIHQGSPATPSASEMVSNKCGF